MWLFYFLICGGQEEGGGGGSNSSSSIKRLDFLLFALAHDVSPHSFIVSGVLHLKAGVFFTVFLPFILVLHLVCRGDCGGVRGDGS